MTERIVDCLIVGGGPAGLTAAIYLARFHRIVMVIDADEGRMAMIPISHNHTGFPDGIKGCDLLARMQAQARLYGAELIRGRVTDLVRNGDALIAQTSVGAVRARAVLLATGVINTRPPMLSDAEHDDAVARGVLRYCPICDAFEQTSHRIGILGADEHALAEAMFLRTYSDAVAMLAADGVELDADAIAQADAAGIVRHESPVQRLDVSGNLARASLLSGEMVELDTVYVALGSRTRNELGKAVGADLVAEDKCFQTDSQMRTSVPGVYAAGDAVEGLDQISFATGSAAIAAVTMHNDLRSADGQTLED